MSRSRQEAIRCSRCNGQQPFTVWESINVTVDPDLKKPLLDGNLTTFHCNRCENEAHVAHDCLYHDMDRSLAIWLKAKDTSESRKAKQMFLAATQIKNSRTVRTAHELCDKIRIYDDGLDDFEIELFKFFTCMRQQVALDLPFHYAEMQRSPFEPVSLSFAVASNDDFEMTSCLLQDYEDAVYPIAEKIRPLLPASMFEWAELNRSFILKVLSSTGMMQATAPSAPEQTIIRAHILGRTPEFEDPYQLDGWLSSGGKTYNVENWRLGIDVSEAQAEKHRDSQSGELYVHYQIVQGQWKGRLVTRELFAKLKAVEDAS